MGNIHIENMFARKSAIRRRGETLVKYTTTSGLDDWIGNISGTIAGSYPNCTSQIPNAKNIEEIQLGDTVSGFGNDAFNGCINLIGITIPNNHTAIG